MRFVTRGDRGGKGIDRQFPGSASDREFAKHEVIFLGCWVVQADAQRRVPGPVGILFECLGPGGVDHLAESLVRIPRQCRLVMAV